MRFAICPLRPARKRFVVSLLAVLLSGLSALPARAAESTRPCNVVILKVDEHNPRYSSVYGHPFVRTPNMERLARMGTVYEAVYCPSPLCLPSRSATMSGRRVHEIQTYNNCNVFTADYPTYGQVLGQQGVHAVHVGKVDVYNRPSKLGFAEMILPDDRKQPGDTNFSRSPLSIRQGAAGRAKRYGPHKVPFTGDIKRMDGALAWLASESPTCPQPWTLEINLDKPHFSHYVTQELWNLYADHADLPACGPECATAQHPYSLDLRAHFETDLFPEKHIRGLRRGYYGCVTFVDAQLGRLLDALEKSGQMKNTLIVYTSDHGEMLGKFGMWWKCCLFDDSVRVPLIVAGPGFAPGMRIKTPVDLHDLRATLFKAVGARQPADWLGQALQENLADDRVVFAEYHGHGTRGSAYMIRRGPWKLIYCAKAPHLLFNLDDDPEELTNLYEKKPEIAAQLMKELGRICDPEVQQERAERYIVRQLEAVKTFSESKPAKP